MSCVNEITPSNTDLILDSCILVDGFNIEDTGVNIRGWGDTYLKTEKYIANASLFFKDNLEKVIFWQTYKIDLENGRKCFKLKFPLKGIEREWKVRFLTNLNESNFSGRTNQTKVKLEIMDNVNEVLCNPYNALISNC